MEKLIKELKGHSGSRIYLIRDEDTTFIRKIRNVQRNYERLKALNGIIPVPEVYCMDEDMLDMEYIHGLDMRTYLENYSPKALEDFLIDTLNTLSEKTVDKDYTSVYNEMLDWIEDGMFSFTRKELVDRLPKVLPQSLYHGDLTLENVIFDITKEKFCLIDPVTVRYDSYIFDIAKLRQDLDCKWFLRRSKNTIDVKLFNIQEAILEKFPIANDDNMLILMLLRVFLHCEQGSLEHEFILREIDRLWK